MARKILLNQANYLSQQRLVAEKLLGIWNRVSGIPGGCWLFSRIIAWNIPYSGSTWAVVKILEPGYCRIVLHDKKSVRNHLDCIHAVALTNLGELASGLALNTALPPSVRAIVVKITTQYYKKARGVLVAECRCTIPNVDGVIEYAIESVIRNTEDVVVARVWVDWRLGHSVEKLSG